MPVFGGTTLKLSKAFWPQRRNCVALAVALELDLALRSSASGRAEVVDLHRVVDDQLGRGSAG
jgi:hypothetical protein